MQTQKSEQKKQQQTTIKTKQTCTDRHIILIGMPGVGKSTAGVILAKVLGYDFLDSDLVIQKQTKKRLKDIIAAEGIEGFNIIENRVNSSISPTHPTVIATGGSVVYGTEAMAHFHKIGVIVYLNISYQKLRRRLGDLDARGVVHKKGQTLLDLYRERCALYETYADVTVSMDGKNIEQTVDALTEALAPYLLTESN